MKGLYKVLPPFATDYSGVCSVLLELGGIVVVHDAGCCTGNFIHGEPRWYGSSGAVFSSGLREINAVLGNDEDLLGKIEHASLILKSRFLAIVGSPAPMVIGTDYQALAHLLSQRTDLPVLTFNTNGMGNYDVGASLAFLELARRFVKPASAGVEGTVNIIGATPLDLGTNRQAKRLISLLADAGCRVVSCWAMGSTLDDIAQSTEAKLNIVVSRAGLAAARYMERMHKLPFLVGIPIGHASSHCFVDNVRRRLGLAGEPVFSGASQGQAKRTPTALVIGEQVMSNAIRECLRLDMGITTVTVASPCGMDQAFMEYTDIYIEDEDSLIALVAADHYDVIVGDPLYRDLVPPSWKGRFVDFPHPALSSRLHWDQDVDYIGEAGLTLFQEGVFAGGAGDCQAEEGSDEASRWARPFACRVG